MNTKLYKTVFLLLLIPALALANGNGKGKGKYTKEKKIEKEFTVNADALLKVRNSYGNISINSWSQNKVVIEVHIKTNGNNEDRVKKRLDEIEIDFDTNQNLVSAKTDFNNGNRSWWSSRKNNVNVTVNYTIKVPVTNNLDLNNDYGHINLDRIEGNTKISCDYGKVVLGELMSDDNVISFDYTNNSSIAYIKSGKINADYSGFEITKSENLIVNADYTNSRIVEVSNIKYSTDYGNLSVANADNIQGNGDYITARFGKVNGNVDINADYGAIKIEELTENAGSVKINSDYTGIKIGYNQNYNFGFELNLGYAGFKGGDDFEYEIKRVKSSDKYYKGYYGSPNSSNFISISADYGSINFNQK